MPDQDEEWPSHVAWLLRNRGSQLEELAHAQAGYCIPASLVLRTITAADPSGGKVATQWLVDTLLSGGLRIEDVAAAEFSKAHETLTWFASHRHRLQGQARNLGSYATLAAVYKAISPYLQATANVAGQPGSRELRRAERDRARRESLILCERPDLTVAVPLSEFAARWWGRGTRWCTAAAKGNAFSEYSAAPLLIAVIPDERVQIYATSASFQMADAADDEVTAAFVAEQWNRLGSLVLWAFERNANALRLVPQNQRTPEMYLSAVRREPFVLRTLSREDPTPVLPSAIYLEAVQNNGSMLAFVPEEHVTLEMCLCAVRLTADALQAVPTVYKTPEVCLAAVTLQGMALRHVPVRKRTPELCLAAATCDGAVLKSVVPRPMRTREVCLAAIGSLPVAFEDVPRSVLSGEFLLDALSANGWLLTEIPPAARTLRACKAAVCSQGMVLELVPVHHRTWEVCRAALNQDPGAVRYVPADLLSEELCLELAWRKPRALSRMPQAFRTRAVCQAAFSGSHDIIQAIPEEHVSEDMALEAIHHDSELLAHVPASCRTEAVCLEAVTQGPRSLRHLAHASRNWTVCKAAVSRVGMLINLVPAEILDEELCLAAVRQDAAALDLVPSSLRTDAVLQAATSSAMRPPAWHRSGMFDELAQVLNGIAVF